MKDERRVWAEIIIIGVVLETTLRTADPPPWTSRGKPPNFIEDLQISLREK